MESPSPKNSVHFQLKWLIFPLAGILLVAWFLWTPPGFLAKVDAIAYAICHRISSHSFVVDGLQFPLCARCTGMYLGALLGFGFQLAQGRLGKMPPLKTFILMGFLVAAFGIDGINSYLGFFPNVFSLYQPQNWIRLVTGTGIGLSISAVLMPAFHQTMWKTWIERSAFSSWKQLLGILALAAFLILTVLLSNTFFFYFLAFLSVSGVLVILTMIYKHGPWPCCFEKTISLIDSTRLGFSYLPGSPWRCSRLP